MLRNGLRIRDFRIVAVAVDAFGCSVFIDHDRFAGDQFGLDVALGAGHIGVPAGQCEMGARIVIEG